MTEDDLLAEIGYIPGNEITDEQRMKLTRRLLAGAVSQLADGSLLQRLTQDHFLLGPGGSNNESARSGILMAVSNALFMGVTDVAHYVEWRKGNRPAGFAGDKLPDTYLPTANTWFEASYPAGSYPTIVPVGDPSVDTPFVKVKRFAIHAVHAGSLFPFPDPAVENARAIIEDVDFLRSATITAFIEDAVGNIHTYAGTVAYGFGGALMWRVNDMDELIGAYQNAMPTKSMSHLAQFSVGELAYLLTYHKADYATLRAHLVPEPQTEWSDNA